LRSSFAVSLKRVGLRALPLRRPWEKGETQMQPLREVTTYKEWQRPTTSDDDRQRLMEIAIDDSKSRENCCINRIEEDEGKRWASWV